MCKELSVILFILLVTVNRCFIMPILQMTKQKLREVGKAIYDPTANIKLEAYT